MDDFNEQLPGAEAYENIEIQHFGSRLNDFYLATRRSDGVRVLLKHVQRTEDATRELSGLKRIGLSPHVVRLLGEHPSALGETVIALEYLPHGDLRSWMDARKDEGRPRDTAAVVAIVRSMLRAVAACHARGVVHCDISPRNFLIKSVAEPSVVLADFGCSIVSSDSATHHAVGNVGTLWYMAPETLFGSKHYGPEVDVFGVGCIAAELLRDRPLFDGSSQLDQICKLVETLGTPDESSWPELATLSDWSLLEFPERTPKSAQEIFPDVDVAGDATLAGLVELVLDGMLTYNPAARPSAAGCLQRLERILERTNDK